MMRVSENNEQQQLAEGFTIICYKIVSQILLQKLINDFAICKHQKHCSGILLLAEDISQGFVMWFYFKIEPHIFMINLEHAAILCYVA